MYSSKGLKAIKNEAGMITCIVTVIITFITH